MSKVAFYTQTYNAQSFIDKTIKSVLNQTYGDFDYFICDDFSRDSTRAHINKFARKDSRVKPVFYDEKYYELSEGSGKENKVIGATIVRALKYMLAHTDAQWICILDHDDYYEPTFLDEMLKLSDAQALDTVCCGSRFFDTRTGQTMGYRQTDSDIIIDNDGWSEFFPRYHVFMRTYWAKLYSREVFEQADFSIFYNSRMGYGRDTNFCLSVLRHTKKCGVSHKVLHNYRMSRTGSSYTLTEARPRGDAAMYEYAVGFLLEKTSHITAQNLAFLQIVQANNMLDTLNVILRLSTDAATLPVTERLRHLQTFFSFASNRSVFLKRIISSEYATQLIDPTKEYLKSLDLLDLGDYEADALKAMKEDLLLLETRAKVVSSLIECQQVSYFAVIQSAMIEDYEDYTEDKACRLLYHMLRDGDFARGIISNEDELGFLQGATNLLKSKEHILDDYCYDNFAMMLICGMVRNDILLILSGVFNADNKFQWGAAVAGKWLCEHDSWAKVIFNDVVWRQVAMDHRDEFLEILEGRYVKGSRGISGYNKEQLALFTKETWIKRGSHEKEQLDLLRQSVDSGNLSDKIIDELTRYHIVAREVLPYVLVNDLDSGNSQRLLELAIMIGNVYDRDPELLRMAALAFSSLNLKDNALECMDLAIASERDEKKIKSLGREREELARSVS